MFFQFTFHAIAIGVFLTLFSVSDARSESHPASLGEKIIVIDPGHGGTSTTDNYRQGPTGEREEWINLRVGLILKKLLEEKGATVLMTRTTDTVVSLADRAKLAVGNKAHLFISIHHNAVADSSVNFPIIYFHGAATENKAGVALAKLLITSFLKCLYQSETPTCIASDYVIFPEAGAGVLRRSYGIPGVIAEASFFTNPTEEQRLKQTAHNENEARAYAEAIEKFFSTPIPSILPKDTAQFPPKFQILQESERMNPIALKWKEDYEEANVLMSNSDSSSIQKAYALFTRSAQSFPDSYLAGKCHRYRAILLKRMGRLVEAAQEERRAEEFYPTF